MKVFLRSEDLFTFLKCENILKSNFCQGIPLKITCLSKQLATYMQMPQYTVQVTLNFTRKVFLERKFLGNDRTYPLSEVKLNIFVHPHLFSTALSQR